jgi:undecaprenyl-diphosphatase
MDAIDALDCGVYYHFDFQNKQGNIFLPLLQTGYYVGSYIGVGTLFFTAIVLFALQRRWRSVLVVPSSGIIAFGLIELVRRLVPRPRPEEALGWLGPGDMIGSYPSPAVFLTLLAFILIGIGVWGLTRNATWRWTFAVIAAMFTVWVCMSQMMLTLHYFSDVLGGLAGAFAIGWTASYLLDSAPANPTTAAESP